MGSGEQDASKSDCRMVAVAVMKISVVWQSELVSQRATMKVIGEGGQGKERMSYWKNGSSK